MWCTRADGGSPIVVTNLGMVACMHGCMDACMHGGVAGDVKFVASLCERTREGCVLGMALDLLTIYLAPSSAANHASTCARHTYVHGQLAKALHLVGATLGHKWPLFTTIHRVGCG